MLLRVIGGRSKSRLFGVHFPQHTRWVYIFIGILDPPVQMRAGSTTRHPNSTNSGSSGHLLTFPDLNAAVTVNQITTTHSCFNVSFHVAVDMRPISRRSGAGLRRD